MRYRELVHHRHAEALGMVRQAGLLTLEAAEAFANLSFNTLRNRLNAHQQWSLAMDDQIAVALPTPKRATRRKTTHNAS